MPVLLCSLKPGNNVAWSAMYLAFGTLLSGGYIPSCTCLHGIMPPFSMTSRSMASVG